MAHLAKKGTKPISYNETDRRLRLFFPDTTLQLARITPEKAAGYYDAFQVGRSVDYHRNTLAEAKSFVRWCVGQHQIKENPLESVEGVGARSTGKAQLTGNEAHVFYAWCVWKASRGDEAAIAVLLCLTLALRQKDVRIRLVRDVDLDAMVLRISDGKTKKSNRPRMVPEVLRPFLRKLVVGRGPLEPLFPAEGGGFHTKTWLRAAMVRFCRDAGVPYICPHALKGQAASVLADSGELSEKIAAHLSHEKVTTTERHYTPRGAVAAAQAGRGLELIQGGAG
jgi:integrase